MTGHDCAVRHRSLQGDIAMKMIVSVLLALSVLAGIAAPASALDTKTPRDHQERHAYRVGGLVAAVRGRRDRFPQSKALGFLRTARRPPATQRTCRRPLPEASREREPFGPATTFLGCSCAMRSCSAGGGAVGTDRAS